MSRLAVARNDLRAARRARGTWLLAALFVVGFAGVASAVAELAAPDFGAFLDVASLLVALLLPLVGVVLGYESVVPERESGSIALTLSLPNSRLDVVQGKLLGRTAVFAGTLLVGVVGGAAVLVARYDGFDAGQYLWFVVVVLAYGLVFLALAAALSMALSTSRRVVGAAFGSYVALVMFWNQFVDVLVVVLFRFRGGALVDPPLWAESAKFLTPRTAFVYLLADRLGVGTGVAAFPVADQWFASPGVAVLALLSWAVVPLALGFLRFRRAEL